MKPRIPILLTIFFNTACATVVLHQAMALPELDPEPIVGSGETSFGLTLQVRSEQFGLASVIIEAIKLFTAQHVNVDPKTWHLQSVSIVDAPRSIYIAGFVAVVPVSKNEDFASQAREFISGGGLEEAFASQGVAGMKFKVVDESTTETPQNTSSEPDELEGTAQVSPTPSKEPGHEPEVNITALVDDLPVPGAGNELSRDLDLYVQSPTIFFPPDLKKALRWFLGEATGTRRQAQSWFVTSANVLNATYGDYVVSFVHLKGNESDVITHAEAFVQNGGLNEALLNAGARNVNVSLLPNLAQPKIEPVGSPPKGFVLADIVLQITAPISGIAGAVESELRNGMSAVSSTEAEDWKLKNVSERSLNGPFEADFAIIVEKGTATELVRNVSILVRSRQLDHTFWNQNRRDVQIRLRARLTTFESGEDESGGTIKSSGGTVAASVVGVLVIFLIGAGILCLVPKGSTTENPNRSPVENENSRPWE